MSAGNCWELALEGEKLCKSGYCEEGVQLFEAAIQLGTSDEHLLSAVYSQLGNAYICLQNYQKALEYHRLDLNVARKMSDRQLEAQASGNLGNALKLLGKYDEATVCCKYQLDISRDLKDRVGEARALYTLGNIYHLKGKQASQNAAHDLAEMPAEARTALQEAVNFYEANLTLATEMGDKAAQGRALGNLGNTHYLLGNFLDAVSCHEQRLKLGQEYGDKSAERRACSNLGNAHIFLGNFETAADYYRRCLALAMQMGDLALEAQSYYSLGNTYTLLGQYELVVEYHSKHLAIAEQLQDKVGAARSCWSLGNAHASLGNRQLAINYASQHLDLSRQVGDEVGVMTAQTNLVELHALRDADNSRISNDSDATSDASGSMSARRRSMQKMELVKLTPEQIAEFAGIRMRSSASSRPRLQRAATVDVNMSSTARSETPSRGANSREEGSDEDNFFEQLSRCQSRRFDDQRCSLRLLDNNTRKLSKSDKKLDKKDKDTKENKNPNLPLWLRTTGGEQFLNAVMGGGRGGTTGQLTRHKVEPSLSAERHLSAPALTIDDGRNSATPLDDQFFDMLIRCQDTRMEDQRSELPPAPTVPDDDFFGLLQRLQASRYEDQRSSLAPLRPIASESIINGSSTQAATGGPSLTANGAASSTSIASAPTTNGDSRKSTVLQKLNSLPGRKSKKGKH